jgi:hypothetical protein
MTTDIYFTLSLSYFRHFRPLKNVNIILLDDVHALVSLYHLEFQDFFRARIVDYMTMATCLGAWESAGPAEAPV